MSVMNKDEAERCLMIAMDAHDDGDNEKAIRLLKKSISMYPTETAKEWLERLTKEPDVTKDQSTENDSSKQSKDSTSNPKRSTSSFFSSLMDMIQPPRDKDTLAVNRILSCKTYYEVLDVEQTAKASQIKRAYFQQARQIHPDKNVSKGADEAFKVLCQAYQILKDSVARKQYDAALADGGGRVDISHVKNITETRFSKDDGFLNYYIIQRFIKDFCIDFVKERVFSPQTWPWADPKILLSVFLAIAMIYFNLGFRSMPAALYLSFLTHIGFGIIIYFLYGIIPYFNWIFWITALILFLPYYYFVKNRVKRNWPVVAVGLVILWIVWRFILGPFIYSLLVLSSFIHTFDYTILMLNNRKTSFGLIGAVFFMSGYAIFQYCIIFLIPLIILKVYTKIPKYMDNSNENSFNHHQHGHGHRK